MVHFENEWDNLLKGEFEKEYYKKIHDFLKSEYANPNYPIYPDMHDIFNAMKITDYNEVKAVILGQDPYHGPNQAHGLSFSVKDGVKPPPSLVNIFKEYHDDLGYPIPKSGDLTPWAKNGVLLLNTVLSVRGGAAASHRAPHGHNAVVALLVSEHAALEELLNLADLGLRIGQDRRLLRRHDDVRHGHGDRADGGILVAHGLDVVKHLRRLGYAVRAEAHVHDLAKLFFADLGVDLQRKHVVQRVARLKAHVLGHVNQKAC